MTQLRLSYSRPLQKTSTSALPHLTKQQYAILTHIFTYRFLTIHQLQAFLGHKHKYRLQVWLNDLITKNYLHQIYNQSSFKAAGTPAIYYLAVNGVRHLRQTGTYSDPELRNRYKEAIRTQDFIDRCLLIADCAINLQRSSNELKTYHWLTPSHFAGIDEELPEAPYLQELRPHLYFTNQPATKRAATRYVLIYTQARLPHTVLRSRLKTLLEYAAYEWSGDEPAPATLIVCGTLADLIYVKQRVRYLLERDYDDNNLDVRVTTTDKLRSEGVTSAIWEVVI